MKRSLMNRFKKIINEDTASVEITDDGVNREAVSDAWTEGVFYKGVNVFDHVYADKILEKIADFIEIGETMEGEPYEEEDENGDIEEFEGESYTKDGQEVYLGYVPSDDVFISGWDTWNPDGSSEAVMFTYDVDEQDITGNMEVVAMSYKSMFYSPGTMGKPSTYKELKKLFPDIIDIRLD